MQLRRRRRLFVCQRVVEWREGSLRGILCRRRRCINVRSWFCRLHYSELVHRADPHAVEQLRRVCLLVAVAGSQHPAHRDRAQSRHGLWCDIHCPSRRLRCQLHPSGRLRCQCRARTGRCRRLFWHLRVPPCGHARGRARGQRCFRLRRHLLLVWRRCGDCASARPADITTFAFCRGWRRRRLEHDYDAGWRRGWRARRLRSYGNCSGVWRCGRQPDCGGRLRRNADAVHGHRLLHCRMWSRRLCWRR